LQTEVEEILFDAVQANGAASGTIVVLDPRNGEILAMASTPEFNPNEYWRLLEIFTGNVPFNRAVSQAYEPGSVFKVLTMAAALDSGTVTPETTFLDQGAIEVGGRIIRNWDNSAWGQQTMLGCLQHSLNVCLAWVATQVGPSTYYDYLNRFGIGQRTWVDIAFEAQGRIRLPNKDPNWTMSDLGTNAFGQSVAVTPLQLAIAISAVPNDGEMMTPHVVWAIIKDGVQYQTPLRSLGQPISQETAKTLNEMLALSLEEESSYALVTGYRVAGKTGTAQIPIPGGFDPQLTNASFVGWGPVDDPRFLVFVWLEKPRTSPWGSVVAAPVFREVVERLVVYLNLPPDDVRRKMAEQVR
jgi:cell division protein FtsI/penicillin-binding protein 2